MNKLQIKTLYFEITHACNQSCVHCYLDGGIHQKIEELTTQEIKDIIKSFKDQGGEYAIITGGEPTVRKDCFEILDYLESLEIPFTFASNSLLINNQYLKKLKDYKNLDLYFTSLLGSNSEEHTYITKRKGYDKVIESLNFLDSNGIKTYIQVTLAHEYMDKMYEIAKNLSTYNNCTIKFTPIASFGTKKTDSKSAAIVVPEEGFEKFHSTVKKLQSLYPNKIEDANIRAYNEIKEMIDDYKNEELYSLCYGFLAVRPDGEKSFSWCTDNPYTFGNAKSGVEVDMDDKFYEYIDILRRAEEETLECSKDCIVEVDVKVEESIKQHFNKKSGGKHNGKYNIQKNDYQKLSRR